MYAIFDAQGNPVSVFSGHCTQPAHAVPVPSALAGTPVHLLRLVDGAVVAVSSPPVDHFAALRSKRDRLINAVSWRYERHARELRQGQPPTDDIAALDAYIQALADLPETTEDPANPVWPEAPQ